MSSSSIGPHAAPPPALCLGQNEVPVYGLLGLTGLAAGIVFALTVTLATDGSWVALAVAVVTGVVGAYVFTVGVRALVGRELLVFYHYLLLVPALGAAALKLGGWPLLPHLEPLVLGLGLMQAVGRWGCLGAGCCHGRPAARWLRPLAVVYGRRHGERGFPRGLLGVPLVPVQVVESGWILAILTLATATVLEAPAGGGLAAYLLLVPAGRFFFEGLRGDARPGLLGLSEAQWISLGLVWAVPALVAAGWLPPPHRILRTVVPAVLTLTAAILVGRRHSLSIRLADARHARDLAAWLAEPHPAAVAPKVLETTAGLRLSTQRLAADPTRGGSAPMLYSFSGPSGPLPVGFGRRLAAQILRLRHPGTALSDSTVTLLHRPDCQHLLVDSAATTPRPGGSG